MANQLSCSYKAGVKQKESSIVKISEIINQIKSGHFLNEVQAIQSSSSIVNDEIVKSLKLQLPVFYPTLVSLDTLFPTGIIQFDIDAKSNPDLDVEFLALSINQLPSTYYSFKSPNHGLKFGILTDFVNRPHEASEYLKERFKFTYDYVSDLLLDIESIPNFNADSAVRSIKQACYVSYDSNAYFNELAVPLRVNDESLSCLPNKLINSTINTHSNDKNALLGDAANIQELLNWIPRDFEYADRRAINYAVCSGWFSRN
ncbi:BT4734/BF3469 family protein [Methylotenera sp.]|uniref:BT4734/BF3469 family protein n=1 Tax=Methylotenera sp. TaxID=2051956 RepID=UPI002730CCF0|nr:BT4734/BF3469 family protein [Methylotenera sp.]MDP2071683.1 BT4734/BF3469 family protein [Methylotenera sp.]MDP3006773.1 BT4734/BF3469 family protein [Methylotenera sp.]